MREENLKRILKQKCYVTGFAFVLALSFGIKF